jgi:hypothetical protein
LVQKSFYQTQKVNVLANLKVLNIDHRFKVFLRDNLPRTDVNSLHSPAIHLCDELDYSFVVEALRGIRHFYPDQPAFGLVRVLLSIVAKVQLSYCL